MSPKSKSSKSKPQPQGEPNSAGDDRATPTRLPFEPASTRKKSAKKAPVAATSASDQPAKAVDSETQAKAGPSTANASTAIPEVVSRRMARRMGVFCGIPTSLGMVTFIVSYIVVSHEWFKLPNVAVVLVSMGFFGLGVLGLSYGVLSASWDEERVGTRLGWGEFTTNFGRLTESWRTAKKT